MDDPKSIHQDPDPTRPRSVSENPIGENSPSRPNALVGRTLSNPIETERARSRVVIGESEIKSFMREIH